MGVASSTTQTYQEKHWLLQIEKGPLLNILSRLTLKDFASLARVSTQFKDITSYAFQVIDRGKILIDPTEKNYAFFRKVINRCPQKDRLWQIVRDPRIDASRCQEVLLEACRQKNKEVVKWLVADGRANPSFSNNETLQTATREGWVEILNSLLADKRVEPSETVQNLCFRQAISQKHQEIIDALLASPKMSKNIAFQMACEVGDTKCVQQWLADRDVDPAANKNNAILRASMFGQIEIIKLLLADPRVDPTADKNYAIAQASNYGHLEAVKLLLADTRVYAYDDKNRAIRRAKEAGHTDIVKLLLNHPSFDLSKFERDGFRLVRSSSKKILNDKQT